jgi:hypothetical protein
VSEDNDVLPTDCGVCKYHTHKTKECRRIRHTLATTNISLSRAGTSPSIAIGAGLGARRKKSSPVMIVWTFWRVTSTYPIQGIGGGCGDGISITAMREEKAKEEKKKKATSPSD